MNTITWDVDPALSAPHCPRCREAMEGLRATPPRRAYVASIYLCPGCKWVEPAEAVGAANPRTQSTASAGRRHAPSGGTVRAKRLAPRAHRAPTG